MGTKNLAKTLVDGKKYRNDDWDVKSNKSLRAAERAYLTKVRLDPENFDEEFLEEKVQRHDGTVRNKSSAVFRWLNAQVGRSWNEVRKEIFEKFNEKSSTGRHLIYDIMLRNVVATNSGWDNRGNNLWDEKSSARWYWRSKEYFVNEEGILSHTDRKHHISSRISNEEYEFVGNVLNGRMIGYVDGQLHWFAPTEGVWKASWIVPHDCKRNEYGYYSVYMSTKLSYQLWDHGEHFIYNSGEYGSFWTKKDGWAWMPIEHPFSFRLRGTLSAEEIEWFNNLDERIKMEILSFTEGRK